MMVDFSDGEPTLILRDGTGSRIPFQAAVLAETLSRAFQAAGEPDEGTASDVALAVEYALLNCGRPGGEFSSSEVGTVVVKLLENAGFGSVARAYQAGSGKIRYRLDADHDTIFQLLFRHLGITREEAESATASVLQAAQQLGIAGAPPELFLELARYYLGTPVPEVPEVQPGSSRELCSADAVRTLLPETRELAARGIFAFRPVRRLFPALRLTFFPARAVAGLELEPPVFDLAMASMLGYLGSVLQTLRNKLEAQLGMRLPVSLTVAEAEPFAVQWLGAAPEDARKVAAAALSPLVAAAGKPRIRMRFASE